MRHRRKRYSTKNPSELSQSVSRSACIAYQPTIDHKLLLGLWSACGLFLLQNPLGAAAIMIEDINGFWLCFVCCVLILIGVAVLDVGVLARWCWCWCWLDFSLLHQSTYHIRAYFCSPFAWFLAAKHEHASKMVSTVFSVSLSVILLSSTAVAFPPPVIHAII